jgi:vancomycin resistance protein VanJ
VKFQVITYNIGNGRADPAKLAGMLIGSGADIVALQEVSQSQGDALENRLQGIFPYRSIYPGGFAGKAILSRFPIKKAVQIQLIMERPDLMAVVDIQGVSVTVIAAHPPPPRFHRTGFHFNEKTRGQISALADLAKDSAPAVLAGDFNLVRSQNEYRSITRKGLKDAFLESGTGFGYTLPRRVGPWRSMQWLNRLISWVPLIPLARVDYIWTTPSIKSNRCWVGRDAGSDHLPVLAKLEIN